MILLFDLAGVLLDFRGVESTFELSEGTVSSTEFGRFWSHSPVADSLYRGRITPEQFASEAIAEWSLRIKPAEFLAAFRSWLIGPYPGAFELLTRLRRHYTLGCLSNTNVLDCERFRRELRLDERFDYCFFSNEIGLRKPELRCYQYVLQHLGAQGEEVKFFDDDVSCVEGARAAGLGAYHCIGLQSVIERVTSLGLLKP